MHRFASILGAVLLLVALPAQANSPWRISKDHWSDTEERGFARFVQAIGETNCASAEACLNSPANPYRKAAALPAVNVDCAKWPYLLRAYYAWNNGLPFSYASAVNGEDDDLRYTKTANYAISRLDLVDQGTGIDADAAIRAMLKSVFTGMYRIDPNEIVGLASDFYSPLVQRNSIRPGTALYDTQGHVGIVYKVGADGRVYYMDAHPDFTITRGVYGPQFPRSAMQLGGGFKSWRPFHLVGATRDAQGHLIGGHMVLATNAQIADFSLVQYTGNSRVQNEAAKASFQYNGIDVGPYEYVRVVLSGGKTTEAPVYELKATLRNVCGELKRPAKSRRDREIREALVALRKTLAQDADLWVHRDPRLAYDGAFLKQDLAKAYEEEAAACTLPGGAAASFERALQQKTNMAGASSGESIKSLIGAIGEQASLQVMSPIGR